VGKFIEFAEILESKIRQKIQRELEQEILAEKAKSTVNSPHKTQQAKPSSTEFLSRNSFFSLESPIYHFAPEILPGTYRKYQAQPKPYDLTESQQASLMHLSQYGLIRNPFTQNELKTLYRKAALATHPDRKGTPEGFIAARRAYLDLQGLCPK